MAQGFTMPGQATQAVACLYFDGINLHYHDDTRMRRAIKLWSYPAISGEHGFQAPALTKHKRLGSIPDGRYEFDLAKGVEAKANGDDSWPEGVANTRLRLVRKPDPDSPSTKKKLAPKPKTKSIKAIGEHFIYLGLDGFVPGSAGSVVVLPSGNLSFEKLLAPLLASGETSMSLAVQLNRTLCLANHPYFDAASVKPEAIALAKNLTIPTRFWHQGSQLLKGDKLPQIEKPDDTPIPTSLQVGGDLADVSKYEVLSDYTLGVMETPSKPLAKALIHIPLGTVLCFGDGGEPTMTQTERTIDYMANVEGQDRPYFDLFGVRIEPSAYILAEDEHGIEDYDAVWNILCEDKAVVFSDGEKRRASTGELVGSFGDRMAWVITGHKDKKTGATSVSDVGQIRLGSKLLLSKDRYWSPQMILEGREHILTSEGLVRNPDGSQSPLHWPGTLNLPKPEDYVLQLSGLLGNVKGTKPLYVMHDDWAKEVKTDKNKMN